jgi:hypothetical protein
VLIVRRLSVDYTLLRSSISKKRRSSRDTRAPLLRCIVCSQDDSILVHAELLVPVRCCGSWVKPCARKLHKLVRRHARVVRTAVVRLSDESVQLSLERRGAMLRSEPPATIWTSVANCCYLRAGCCRTVCMCWCKKSGKVHSSFEIRTAWSVCTVVCTLLCKMRIRCTRLPIPVATEVMALWRRSGDGRALRTHAQLAMERRTVYSGLSVGREESQ